MVRPRELVRCVLMLLLSACSGRMLPTDVGPDGAVVEDLGPHGVDGSSGAACSLGAEQCCVGPGPCPGITHCLDGVEWSECVCVASRRD